MAVTADARPTKRFFISNLTRDLSLEDAILDLIDNSIDALIRSRDLDVSADLLKKAPLEPEVRSAADALVTLYISSEQFTISDHCGGIDIERAQDEVFRLGRVDKSIESSLGVYGIGLKRAIFKIGSLITIESKTEKSGFEVTIDVEEWIKDDDDWTLPLTPTSPATSPSDAGTKITIRQLYPEVKMRVEGGGLLTRLSDEIATTYSLFLTHFLTVSLNENSIIPRQLPLASSTELPPNTTQIRWDGVVVELFAGLAMREGKEWHGERAGWYVLCNGRVVLSADKTERTGWGHPGPLYQSKFRGFIGIAFFFSSDPAVLPWTTTKRDLNEESAVYQVSRKEMTQIARPVLSFLNKMYPSEPAPEVQERMMADRLQPANLQLLAKEVDTAVPRSTFSTVPIPPRAKRTTISVQYSAEKSDIERIKNKIGHPEWGAGSIGRFTFDYYLKSEFAE